VRPPVSSGPSTGGRSSRWPSPPSGAQRTDVAAAVFDAADQPGAHRDVLRRRRTELLGASDGPVLRVFDGGA
jgi:hypothetical protein